MTLIGVFRIPSFLV